ncbi:MAG: 5'-nucleotidase C-terminal domain-containing protein [Clostridia bacterium]|nr:5'-nucleotidase C-terminal domain-containing protein [Clostridia bacterium]
MKKIVLLILMVYVMMLGVSAEPVQPVENAPIAVEQEAAAPSNPVPQQPATAAPVVQQETAPVTVPAATPVPAVKAPAPVAQQPVATAPVAGEPTPTPQPLPYLGSADVSILFTTDIHGNFQRDEKTGVLGYSGINAIARSVPNSILVDGGDYLSSGQFVSEDSVNSILSLMNATGYHVAGIGETDLAHGVAVLKDVKDRAAFHMLSSNVTTGLDRTPLLGDTIILDVQGIRVGFFSLLNPELRLSASLQELTDVYLEDASKMAQASVNSLKQQGADVIIAVSHMGNQSGSGIDQIAAFVSGIDYIFDGHDHVEETGRFIGDTMIINPGAGGTQLVQLDLHFGPGKEITGFSTTQWFYEATKSLAMDPALVALEESIVAQQNEFLKESVAVSRVDIDYTDDILFRSHPLGNFIADAYREKTKATVALVDAGSIAVGIPTGDITKASILAILPKNHSIQTKKITPKILKTALESGLSGITLLEDGMVDPASATEKFPQISGVRVQVNLNNEPGKRVVKMTLDNGVSLNLNDDRTSLIIASNTGILSGLNDYGIFEMQPVLEEYDSEGQALLEYLNYTGEYSEYQSSRIELTDNQESYTMLLLTIAVVFAFVVMILILIIKLMARVS